VLLLEVLVAGSVIVPLTLDMEVVTAVLVATQEQADEIFDGSLLQ
jgi:hypothetical protein